MYKRIFKRLLDFLIALIATPFVLLAILVMAPIIYFNDPGPVFYNANRIGKNGRYFKMFKLRSMYVNAPDIRNADGSTYNGDRDPRVTKIGRIMRKTSIDELPQILNVLIGDMSFVGPRPTVSAKQFVLSDLDAMKQKHYEVRPGITGYSQAYFRNSISQEEKYENDAYYVDHISFLFDVKILFQTVTSVLMRKNIYVEQSKAEKKKEEALK